MRNIYVHISIQSVFLNYIQAKCFQSIVLIYQALSDLALRSMIGNDRMEEERVNAAGILMALCCHHRCDWGSYTGKDFMLVCTLQ
jgi:tRNA:m4X modification enzyme